MHLRQYSAVPIPRNSSAAQHVMICSLCQTPCCGVQVLLLPAAAIPDARVGGVPLQSDGHHRQEPGGRLHRGLAALPAAAHAGRLHSDQTCALLCCAAWRCCMQSASHGLASWGVVFACLRAEHLSWERSWKEATPWLHVGYILNEMAYVTASQRLLLQCCSLLALAAMHSRASNGWQVLALDERYDIFCVPCSEHPPMVHWRLLGSASAIPAGVATPRPT